MAVGVVSILTLAARAQTELPAAPGLHEPILMAPAPETMAPEPPDPMSFDMDMLGDDDMDTPAPQREMPPPPPPRPGEMAPPPGVMPPPPGAEQMQRPLPKPDPKKIEQMKDRILELKYDRMRKAVAIDSATWPRFFAIYKPAETDIEAIMKARGQEMRKLADIVNGAKTDADVDPEMAKIRGLNRTIEDRVAKLNDDLKSVISPRQRARLLMFEREFNGRIRDEVRRERAMSPEERQARQQKLRDWWMKNHPKRN